MEMAVKNKLSTRFLEHLRELHLVEKRLADRQPFMRRMMNEDDAEEAFAADLLKESFELRKLYTTQLPRRRRAGDGHRHGAGKADEGNFPASPDKREIVMRSETRAIVRHERHPVLERFLPRHRDAGIVIAGNNG